jgi:hypothetical protein
VRWGFFYGAEVLTRGSFGIVILAMGRGLMAWDGWCDAMTGRWRLEGGFIFHIYI